MLLKPELLKKYYAELTGLLIFIVYLFTLAPSVIQIDSGELAAVQSILGIAHPTGYPLFTIVGYLFLKIPLPFTNIFKANLLAALWCSLGIVFFIKSIKMIFSISNSEQKPRNKFKSKKSALTDTTNSQITFHILPISILSGILLAFSKTYWFQSTSVEVYSLQIFLFNLIIYSSLKTYLSTENKITNWIKVGIAMALGFSNHMTTMLVLPFVAILFFMKEGINITSFKKIGITFFISLVVLILIYLYLPIRAHSNPELNWGNPINLENFWRHFTGKQYQVWLFSSFDSAKKQLKYFFENLPSEFGYIGLIFIAVGFISCLKMSKKIFYLLLITALFALLYSINYDIIDIDSYFLLTYIILSIFGAFGIIHLVNENITNFNITAALITLFVLIPAIVNYSKMDQSEVYTFEDYTRAVLQSTEKNSIIFSYQWDYLISPSYYFGYVEGFRNDVVIIDKELLRRSWYYNQLERNYPDVIKNLKSDINNFLTALKPFEKSEDFNPELLERYYRRIMTNLISKNISKRNYYIGLELFQNEMQRGEFQLPEGYKIVPHLFLFKVTKGNDYVPAPDPNFNIRFPKNRNKYIDFIENAVGTMLTYRILYEMQFGKVDRAKLYLNKIRNDLINFHIPAEIIRLVENN